MAGHASRACARHEPRGVYRRSMTGEQPLTGGRATVAGRRSVNDSPLSPRVDCLQASKLTTRPGAAPSASPQKPLGREPVSKLREKRSNPVPPIHAAAPRTGHSPPSSMRPDRPRAARLAGRRSRSDTARLARDTGRARPAIRRASRAWSARSASGAHAGPKPPGLSGSAVEGRPTAFRGTCLPATRPGCAGCDRARSTRSSLRVTVRSFWRAPTRRAKASLEAATTTRQRRRRLPARPAQASRMPNPSKASSSRPPTRPARQPCRARWPGCRVPKRWPAKPSTEATRRRTKRRARAAREVATAKIVRSPATPNQRTARQQLST